ncbi:MAG: calcium:proton antiporter [Pseudomonadota bacterium]
MSAGPAKEQQVGLVRAIVAERPFLAGAATTILFTLYGNVWLADLANPWTTGLLFAWLFAVMLWSAFGVVRHADGLADLVGEPLGTLVLTLSVISIEVALISAIMLTGDAVPELARDTMLAVVMIVLNGMVGVALLIGGFKHKEQAFNLEGARIYLVVLVPLATMALILPRFTTSTPDPTLTPLQGILFALMTIALYATFLAMQTRRHAGYFVQPDQGGLGDDGGHGHAEPRSVPFHAVFLLLTMLPIVLLSKKLALLVDFGIGTLGAPAALGGVLVAILVLTPEGLAAFSAALANRLQRSVNICLGSALATIGLTVPAVVTIGLLTGKSVVLGLDSAEIVLLVLTLLLSTMTFGGVRTNMLQGAVHLIVFMVYVVLIFAP